MDKPLEEKAIQEEPTIGTGLAIDLKDLGLKDLGLKDLDLKTLKQSQDLSLERGMLLKKCPTCGRKILPPRKSPAPKTKEDYIEFIRKTHKEISQEDWDNWEKWYGDKLNIEQTIYLATTWLITNHTQRKKKIMKFYVNWLIRDYQRARQPLGG